MKRIFLSIALLLLLLPTIVARPPKHEFRATWLATVSSIDWPKTKATSDANRLRQVFLNILDNAAKHGGEGKRIKASMDMTQDMVVVRIRDYGPGIPEEELPLVKKKFYKGSSKVRGTGIGLAVCDEIVAMHGGELELNNAEGGGTLVSIKLPVVQ